MINKTFMCVAKKYDDNDEDYNDYNTCKCDKYDCDNCECDDYSYETIKRMYPDARFIISIPLRDMNRVISDLDKIIVKQTFDCYCYDGYEPELLPLWFPIRCSSDKGEKMTNGFVIKELIRQGLTLDCNHCFLEGFQLSSQETNCQFDMILGS